MVGVMALLISIAALLPYCYYSSVIAFRLQRAADDMYNSLWYKLPNNFKKYYILSIAAAQPARYFTGSHVINCSLETFKMVLHSHINLSEYVTWLAWWLSDFEYGVFVLLGAHQPVNDWATFNWECILRLRIWVLEIFFSAQCTQCSHTSWSQWKHQGRHNWMDSFVDKIQNNQVVIAGNQNQTSNWIYLILKYFFASHFQVSIE